MAAAAEQLREAVPDREGLVLDRAPLTAETIRATIRETCRRLGAPAPPDVIVASIRQGKGHDPGYGVLPASLPIQIDLWPCDEQTGCWADMTRTFVVGEVEAAVRERETLVRSGLELARAAVRPGITGRELYDMVCELFEGAGFGTQRTGPLGDDPSAGFQFSLGHGVGLEVHEDPSLGRLGTTPLLTGDVIALEPELWEPGIGGVRFEDLLLVTDHGSETLTSYPYELRP
jgi:Xaa-Pro aminopeptidase